MAWGGRDGARTFCGAITVEAEIKKTNENLVFRSTYTNFNLLRSLKVGCISEILKYFWNFIRLALPLQHQNPQASQRCSNRGSFYFI